MNDKVRMPSRDELADIFFDTEKFYKAEPELQQSIQKSIDGSKVYVEDDYPAFERNRFDHTAVYVSRYRTFQTAHYHAQRDPSARIGVLNFASAVNPGGGVLKGSRAQEEALCRCSTLYAVISNEKFVAPFYSYHRKRHDVRYTDRCIYSPDIVVIKSDIGRPERLTDDQWLKVDVLTCAAPKLRERPNNKFDPGDEKPIKVSDAELFDIHVKRGEHILTIAAHHDIDILILGAFGCGAFRNNPSVVADAYKKILSDFDGTFKEIVFAVYCPPNQNDDNYRAFNRVFGVKKS